MSISITPAFAFWQSIANSGLLFSLLQTIIALTFVCALAYAVIRWVLPHLAGNLVNARIKSPRGMVRVVDSINLEPQRKLHVIEVAGRWMLVASSETGINMISELDAAAADSAIAAGELAAHVHANENRAHAGYAIVHDVFANQLGRLLNRRR